jgi:hypothetical protein
MPLPERNMHVLLTPSVQSASCNQVGRYALQETPLRQSATPNPSVNLTRYGRPCKPGPRQSYYRRGPGLQVLPPRAGYLER